VLKLNSGDKLSQIYIDRCKQLRENPPQGGWNGVWVMKSKIEPVSSGRACSCPK